MYAKACYITVWFTLWKCTESSFLHSLEDTCSLSFTSAQDAHQHRLTYCYISNSFTVGSIFLKMIFKRSVLILVDWWHLSCWSTSNILISLPYYLIGFSVLLILFDRSSLVIITVWKLIMICIVFLCLVYTKVWGLWLSVSGKSFNGHYIQNLSLTFSWRLDVDKRKH